VNCGNFDGSNDKLSWKQTPSAWRLVDAVAAASWHFFCVVNIDAIATNATDAFDNDTIMGDAGGYWTVALRTGKVIVGQYDSGGEKNIESAISLSTDTLIESWYDGSKLNLRIGSAAAAAQVAAGSISTTSGFVSIGAAYGSHYANGRIGGILTSKVQYTGADVTNIRNYYNTTYGVAV
jgi:hypothetical protein